MKLVGRRAGRVRVRDGIRVQEECMTKAELRHWEVTEEQAESRIRNKNNRSRNLTHEQRVDIGVDAHFETAKVVAEKYGIAAITAAEIKGGFIQTREQRATGKDNTLKRDIMDVLEFKKRKIIRRSTAKLLAAINGITEEDINGASVRVKAGIAKDMATVIEKVSSLGQKREGTNVQVVVFRPQVLTESDLGDAIEVTAERVR